MPSTSTESECVYKPKGAPSGQFWIHGVLYRGTLQSTVVTTNPYMGSWYLLSLVICSELTEKREVLVDHGTSIPRHR